LMPDDHAPKPSDLPRPLPPLPLSLKALAPGLTQCVGVES
jgi:hypothetical protein